MIENMEMEIVVLKEPEVLKETMSPHGKIELRSDGILFFRPDVYTFKEYDIEILDDLRRDFLKITEGTPRPYIADNRHITGLVTKEEKEYINRHMEEFAISMALITHSPVMNVMINTFMAMFKPKLKIRLFKNEEDAVEWSLKG